MTSAEHGTGADLAALRAKVDAAPTRRQRQRILDAALESLGETRDPDALAFLAEVAGDPNASAASRARAVDLLRAAGPLAASDVRKLVEDGVVEPGLPWALAETGTPQDADLLVRFLDQRGVRLRVNAVVALDRLDAPATHEGFRRALLDRRVFVRASAISALRERCSDAELLDAIEAARRDLPWYRLMTRRYFTLWARRPLARELRRRRGRGVHVLIDDPDRRSDSPTAER